MQFFGEFSVKQFNEKGQLEKKYFLEPLPNTWNDNSNLYSTFIIKAKNLPDKLIFKNGHKNINLKRGKDNKYNITREEFSTIVKGQAEAIVKAVFQKFECVHKIRIGQRD